MRCTRVGCMNKALFQWNACADNNLWRPLCGHCDVAINKLVLEWFGDPQAQQKVKAYAKSRGIQ